MKKDQSQSLAGWEERKEFARKMLLNGRSNEKFVPHSEASCWEDFNCPERSSNGRGGSKFAHGLLRV